MGLKALRVTVAYLAPQDLWDQLVRLGKKENTDSLVVQDDLVFLEEKERKEILLALRAHLVLLAHLDFQEGFLD